MSHLQWDISLVIRISTITERFGHILGMVWACFGQEHTAGRGFSLSIVVSEIEKTKKRQSHQAYAKVLILNAPPMSGGAPSI